MTDQNSSTIRAVTKTAALEIMPMPNETQNEPAAARPATIGQSILTWEQVLPLVRALRDIAQCSPDPEAVSVAGSALRDVFPGQDGLNMIFGRLEP